MKKNFIKAAFVAAFASIAGYGVYTSCLLYTSDAADD